jgi:transposase
LDRLPSNLPINRRSSRGIEVLGGPERRRRWSGEEKARIVAESLAPDAVASLVALRHGVHRNQLYAWRRQLRAAACAVPGGGVAFAPIVVTDVGEAVRSSAVEIALGGAVVRVTSEVDAVLLATVLRTLKQLG